MKNTVEIDIAILTQQVSDGMKKPDLAKHWGISVNQMTKALKEANLKIRKFHHPVFKLVTADVAAPTTEVAATDLEHEEDNAGAVLKDSPLGDADGAEAPEVTEETENNATWTH